MGDTTTMGDHSQERHKRSYEEMEDQLKTKAAETEALMKEVQEHKMELARLKQVKKRKKTKRIAKKKEEIHRDNRLSKGLATRLNDFINNEVYPKQRICGAAQVRGETMKNLVKSHLEMEDQEFDKAWDYISMIVQGVFSARMHNEKTALGEIYRGLFWTYEREGKQCDVMTWQ